MSKQQLRKEQANYESQFGVKATPQRIFSQKRA